MFLNQNIHKFVCIFLFQRKPANYIPFFYIKKKKNSVNYSQEILNFKMNLQLICKLYKSIFNSCNLLKQYLFNSPQTYASVNVILTKPLEIDRKSSLLMRKLLSLNSQTLDKTVSVYFTTLCDLRYFQYSQDKILNQ